MGVFCVIALMQVRSVSPATLMPYALSKATIADELEALRREGIENAILDPPLSRGPVHYNVTPLVALVFSLGLMDD